MRMNALFLLALSAVLAGCGTFQNWKSDSEVTKQDGRTITATKAAYTAEEPVQLPDDPSWLAVEALHYRHPLTGTVRPPFSFLADSDEELCLLLIVVTYEGKVDGGKRDLADIVAVFKDPLILDTSRVEVGKHDWFTEGFDLSNLPKGAEAAYWLGFNGSVTASSDKSVPLESFVAKGIRSRKNGPRLWPLALGEGKNRYVYMKIAVLEETGHSALRSMLPKSDGSPAQVLVDISNKDIMDVKSWVSSLRALSGFAAEKAVDRLLKADGLIDVEYAYSSCPENPSRKLFLRHVRSWGSTNSFELQLRLVSSLAEARSLARPAPSP